MVFDPQAPIQRCPALEQFRLDMQQIYSAYGNGGF